MCKPSCCPGTSGSSGLGAAVLIVGAVTVIVAVARPIVHAATVVLHAIITITITILAVLAGLTVLTAVALITRRLWRSRSHRPRFTVRQARPAIQVAPHPAPFTLTAGEQARCQALGVDPDQVAQLIAAVLGGPQ